MRIVGAKDYGSYLLTFAILGGVAVAVFVILVLFSSQIFGTGIQFEEDNFTPSEIKAAPRDNPLVQERFYSSLENGCDGSLWLHVWNPARLQVLNPCITVTGKIKSVIYNREGDLVMKLRLDPQYSNLTNSVNEDLLKGYLLIKAVCQSEVSEPYDKEYCKFFGEQKRIEVPRIDANVEVKGPYVLNTNRGWTEIHPAESLRKI